MALSLAALKAIAAGRATGKFQMSGKGLQQVPSQVWDYEESLPSTATGDQKWWEVNDPQRLDLSRNKLTALPEQLSSLASLTFIDCSVNQLSAVFESITELQSLASLNCSDNRIQRLPEGLGARQQQLAVVLAANNLLEHIPQGMRTCTSLIKLDLSKNRIQQLPGQICLGMRSLTELDLSNNRVSGALPLEMGAMRKLKVLNVRDNQISHLPPSLCECQNLVELHAGNNALCNLPVEISALSELKTFDLRSNRFTELPVQLCSLRLVLLDLTNNDLRSLPAELGLMTTLRGLPLDGNPLKQIRRELVTGPISGLLRHLQSRLPDAPSQGAGVPSARSGNVFGLDEAQLAADAARKLALGSGSQELLLKGAGLTEVPAQVWEAAGSLQKLDLSSNQIRHLPAGALAGCNQLKVLLLNQCGLVEWPLPLQPDSLPVLTELQMKGNPGLRAAPPGAFTSCSASLARLELSGVPAGACLPPGTLASLTKLEHLGLACTGTTAFPMEVLELRQLRTLDFTTNKLTTIPEHISIMTKLDELLLASNDLVSLPPQLGLLSLRALSLEGNMLKSIRRPILEKGTLAVLAYLKDRIPV